MSPEEQTIRDKPNGPEKQGLGWAYQILPYLEQNAVKGILTQADIQKTVVLSISALHDVHPRWRTPLSIGGPIAALCDYAAAHPLSLKCGARLRRSN